MKDFKKIVKYYRNIISRYQHMILIPVILFSLGNIISGVFMPIYSKKIVDIASIQFSSGVYSMSELNSVILIIAGLLAMTFLLYRVGSHLLAKYENRAVTDIHLYSFKKVQEQSFDFFANNFIGTLTGKVSRLAKNYRSLYSSIFFGFILLFIDIVATLTVLFFQNTFLGILFASFIVIFIFLSFIFVSHQKKYDIERAKQSSNRSGVISDIFTNIFTSKIFSATDRESEYYNAALQKLDSARINSWDYGNRVRVYKSIFFFIFEIGAIYLTLRLFVLGQVSVGVFILVQVYLFNIIRQSWNLDKNMSSFIESYSDTLDSIDIINAEKSVKDIKNPEDQKMKKGLISFENISFTYPKGDHVFENFNLNIPEGQSVGIVGKSGSGKTTLTKLLLRFYNIDSGEIKIDNQNISSVRQSDLRKSIAYIPQETILFHRSVYENIAYGDPEASYDEVVSASIAAHVDEFVKNFENKYETKVGERGVKLSGGQRQRIGIARAMLRKNAPILMLDEATSSLDSMSEKYIQESFEKLSKNRTTIVIAHRLSTIQKLDRIIVMENGKIIEDGSHDNLISKNGHYAQLWNSQINGFIQDETYNNKKSHLYKRKNCEYCGIRKIGF